MCVCEIGLNREMIVCDWEEEPIITKHFYFPLKYLVTKLYFGNKIISSPKIKILATKIVLSLNDIKILKIIGDKNIFVINNFIIGDQFFRHQKSINFGALRKY